MASPVIPIVQLLPTMVNMASTMVMIPFGKSKAVRTLDNLKKSFIMIESGKDIEKAISKLNNDIPMIHKMLYGDNENAPNKKEINTIVPLILNNEFKLFSKLSKYLNYYDFETKKKASEILNYIIRRCGKNNAALYIESNSNIIIDLIKGYKNPQLSQHIGSVLQEMAKRTELTDLLLNKIKIPIKNNEFIKQQKCKDTLDNNNNILNNNDTVNQLLFLIETESFELSIDAHKTLDILLKRNKEETLKYLLINSNYLNIFNKLNKLIIIDNKYATQMKCLKLLCDLLLEKLNKQIMIRYLSEKDNLIIAMTLIKSHRKTIAFEIFHIFKLFVCNPNKSNYVYIVLWKNKDKLIKFLNNFLNEKNNNTQNFMEEKEIVINNLKQLETPKDLTNKIENKIENNNNK